jgi:CPA1 family monovalent cation:H+ antiporter
LLLPWRWQLLPDMLARPYPVFLAIGGAFLALLPAGPSFTLRPELVLALFVAPVLLDTAYDASLRDLKDNWRSDCLSTLDHGVGAAAIQMVPRP